MDNWLLHKNILRASAKERKKNRREEAFLFAAHARRRTVRMPEKREDAQARQAVSLVLGIAAW